jgi:hypothetical protein
MLDSSFIDPNRRQSIAGAGSAAKPLWNVLRDLLPSNGSILTIARYIPR